MLYTLLAATALAGGRSTDIELVRPTTSAAGVAGVEAPDLDRVGALRLGLGLQYARAQLVLYEWGEPQGGVVDNRFTTTAGISVDVSRKLTLRASLPLAVQWGSDVPAFEADGFGLGDASAGAILRFDQQESFTMGLRTDLFLPTGSRDRYLGEGRFRFLGSLLARIGPPRVHALVEVGALARSTVDTEEDFILGSELVLNGGLRGVPIEDRLGLTAAFVVRTGLAKFFAGGAETSLELVGGAELELPGHVRVDLNVGRGVGTGYGTSAIRIGAGVTWSPVRGKPPPEPERPLVVVTERPRPLPELDDVPDEDLDELSELPDPGDPDPVITRAPEPEWKEGELAKVTATKIEIREPIRFEFGTAKILPESLPVLHAIEKLLNANPRIAHVLVEGHASEEGSFAFNFQLSNERARAIFRKLVEVGVHPDRLSYRGMGEVSPETMSAEDIAKNRRVVFSILVQALEGPPPTWPSEYLLPWSGEPRKKAEAPK